MADEKTSVTWDVDVSTGDSAQEVENLAKTLDDMRDSMRANTGELKVMKESLKALRAGGAQFKQQAEALKNEIDAKKKFIAQTQLDWIKLGGAKLANQRRPKDPDNDPKRLSDVRLAVQALSKAFQESGTAAGRMLGQVTRFAAGLSAAKLMVVALAGAIVAATVAVVVWTKRLAESAIAAQDARRNELLHFEALTRVRNLMGIMPGKAKDMQAAVDRISASVSISRGEVASLGQQLYQSGLRGKRFETVLEAASIKASALGSAAGSAFAGFAADVHHAGASVERAARDIKNRFGDVVQAKMKSLEVQSRKVKESFDSLFSGVDIEPLLTVNKQWNDMLSVTTETGKALRSFATAFLQPIVNAVTSVWNVTRRFLKQMLIGLLDLGIAYRTVKLWFVKTFGGPEVESIWGKFFTWLKPGRILVWALAGALTFLAVKVALVTWPFLLAGAAVWGLVEAGQQFYALWKEIDWGELGANIINGLVGGIKAAWTAIKSVAGDLADELTSAFKLALGIQSPSKVFAELGLQIPRGVKKGIDEGSGEATGAASKLVQPPTKIAPIGTGQPAAAKSGNITLTIGEIKVTVGDEAGAKAVAQGIRRELETVLAGLAEQIGAAGVPA